MKKVAATLQGREARAPKPPNPEEAKPVTANSDASDNNKRKPDNGGFNNSEYYKIRAIVKELRPFFMEALHTPDFRESKAANEIRKGMNTMIELAKNLAETASALKPNTVPEQLDGAVMEDNSDKNAEFVKQSKHPESSEIRAAPSINSGIAHARKEELKSTAKFVTKGLSRGSFIVGGSPIGWNYLLYPGRKLFYYGRTKESVLAARASRNK